MATLLNHDGQPLLDSQGQELKKGQAVVDLIHGEGITDGTVPLAAGEGVNVLIKWLRPKDSSKPASRSSEFLTKQGGEGEPDAVRMTVRAHSGAQYESGQVYEARGRNNQEALKALERDGLDTGGAAYDPSPERRRPVNPSPATQAHNPRTGPQHNADAPAHASSQRDAPACLGWPPVGLPEL